jgi:hypothetical protein
MVYTWTTNQRPCKAANASTKQPLTTHKMPTSMY